MNDKAILLSALVIADGEPDAVMESIVSLKTKFSDPDRIEILLHVNDEDQDMILHLPELKAQGAIPVVQPPSVDPYPRGEHLNNLAKKATGYWLFPFDSNALMTTNNWDTPLHRIRDDACMAYFKEIPATDEPYTYPVITANIYQECGSITLISQWADWLRNLVSLSGLRTYYLPDAVLSVVRKSSDVSTVMDFSKEVAEALANNAEDSSALVQHCLTLAEELRTTLTSGADIVAYYG